MSQASLKARMLEAFRFRMYFFTSVVAIVFLIIILQLVNLQIIQGKEYANRSRSNMESYVPIPASRGEIYDRNFVNGEKNYVIVSNRPSFNITTIPAKFESKDKRRETIANVAKLLGMNYDDLIKEMETGSPWERFVIKEDVNFKVVVSIASRPDRYPNIFWEDAPVRVYNYGNMFAHAVGYIGSISGKEYSVLKNRGYRHYQKIGKTGVEKEYDFQLRGTDGFIRRIVDVRNRTEGEEMGQRSVAGNNIVLNIDFEVQKAAFEALKDIKGGAVVIRPATGEIIAMVSKPDFDPNLVTSKNNSKIISELYKDESKPFINRMIQSKYPPASTFKLVTAIAGLETEKQLPAQSYYCGGKYTLKGYIDHDFYDHESHGTLDLYWGIAKSCSIYFYQYGAKVGPTNLMKYAEYFGLNEKTGVDIPGEVSGFVPSRKWKLKTFGQPWFDGDTLNMSIGQGFLHVTPIEMANFISAVVNNGIVYKPRVIKEILTPENSRLIKKTEKEMLREIPLSPSSLAVIKQGMRMSVTSGTSGRLNYLKVPLAGKTGTAQTKSKRKEDSSQHAWFVGYGPYDADPEKAIATAVIVEYGVTGAATAVPVAERIFAKLYELGYFK